MSEQQKFDQSAAGEQGTAKTDAGADSHSQQRPQVQKAKPKIASEEDCLAALSQLPALVTMGLVDLKQANTYKGIYGVILQHYQKKQVNADHPVLDQPGLADVLRKNPRLANILEPLLSREQIEALMRQGNDADAT